MELSGLGGGLMLAIAAALWLAYLVPSWLKQREYLATERNAVRLQQTIRVLAETSEIPAHLVRAAPKGPVAVGRPVVLPAQPDPQLLAARRLRRTRVLASLVLFVSLAVVLTQAVLMIGFGAAAGSWVILAASALSAVCSVALLGRLAEVARARRKPAERASRTPSAFTDHAPVATPQRTREAWTPVAVPKPLYLSRAEAPAARAADPAVELEIAAAAAQRALRDAEQPPAVTPAPAPTAAPSRFAAMGIVDASDTSTPDIDAVLARRRAAG